MNCTTHSFFRIDKKNWTIGIIFIACLTLGNIAKAENCEVMHEGSTMQSACFLQRSTNKIEQEINNALSLLSKVFLKREYATNDLENSQHAWILFRQHQCSLENHVFGGINGISSAQCHNDLTSERLKKLNQLLEIVK